MIFAGIGIYLTFFDGSTSEFDSQIEAYKIDANETYDSDSGYMYYPIYYFKVNEKEYECKAKSGSSTYPKEKKNKVYYDSKNPKKCKTEYEKSSSLVAGIICLIAAFIIIYFFVIKKPSDDIDYTDTIDSEKRDNQGPITEENIEKAVAIFGKVQLIYKRITLGIIIAILLFFILIDTMIVKQTIKSKDYKEVTALFTDRKVEENDDIFDNYIYTFTDQKGNQQEITVSISKGEEPKEQIKIKYNEDKPQDYYEESAIMDKSGIIWYMVKVVALILLVILFFNKKILNKIGIFVRKN